MNNPEEYGENWAKVYDEYVSDRWRVLDPTPTVKFLKELATAGSVLELGVGTGRVALPLAETGLIIHGLEASETMISILKSKPKANLISVIVGDYSEFDLPDRYSLIYAVYNGILMLHQRSDQINCFKSVERALEPGGKFVVEAQIPDLTGFRDGAQIELARMNDNSIELRVTEHRRIDQQLLVQHIWLEEGRIRMKPVKIRYAWPSELDLMANLAGLNLESRYGGWNYESFDRLSHSHISVYKKPL
jgi:SAM-dependent methyltransferase